MTHAVSDSSILSQQRSLLSEALAKESNQDFFNPPSQPIITPLLGSEVQGKETTTCHKCLNCRFTYFPNEILKHGFCSKDCDTCYNWEVKIQQEVDGMPFIKNAFEISTTTVALAEDSSLASRPISVRRGCSNTVSPMASADDSSRRLAVVSTRTKPVPLNKTQSLANMRPSPNMPDPLKSGGSDASLKDAKKKKWWKRLGKLFRY